MSIPIRIGSESCHQPPRNTRRADAATLAIASNSCYQSPKPFSSLKGMGVRGRRCDRLGLALIDWPVVGVAAAFAMLFVVGLTMTAWLLEVRPAFGPPAAAPISESSTGLERISEEQEEVLTTLPASSRSFEPSSDHPAPFSLREKGERRLGQKALWMVAQFSCRSHLTPRPLILRGKMGRGSGPLRPTAGKPLAPASSLSASRPWRPAKLAMIRSSFMFSTYPGISKMIGSPETTRRRSG
jgi:hypothetical protein